VGSEIGQRQEHRGEAAAAARPGPAGNCRPAGRAEALRARQFPGHADRRPRRLATGATCDQRGFPEGPGGLAKRLQEQFGTSPATADGLLALRGVLDIPEAVETEEQRTALDAAILSALDTALAGLEQARQNEGAALRALLSGHIDAIETLTLKAEADPSREPAAIRERIAEQVRLLMDASANLDAARLHQEAAFLATKADIREEIDRLKTHVASARTLLGSGGAVGRKLDFLAQEFNRESNTLCSKSNAAAVTAIGLELKAVVDQFREQVQNLE
jgi:uncharacterized protein (TIGR00255 family)